MYCYVLKKGNWLVFDVLRSDLLSKFFGNYIPVVPVNVFRITNLLIYHPTSSMASHYLLQKYTHVYY